MNQIKIEISGDNIYPEDAGEIVFDLTEAQLKALYWDIKSLKEWVMNIFTAKTAQTIKAIVKTEVEKMMKDSLIQSIPNDKEAIVLAADVKSAKERQEEFEKVMVTNSMSEKTKE